MSHELHTQVPALPVRSPEAHKGSGGTVVVIGGSPRMIGAPALAASGALRAGAGLVKIATCPEILPQCLAIEPCATGLEFAGFSDPAGLVHRVRSMPAGKVVLAIGPGWSADADRSTCLKALLNGNRMPCVLDADGLNHLAGMAGSIAAFDFPCVLTPHPGEYRRLADATDIQADPVHPEQRVEAAVRLAQRFSAVVLLKGKGTVISDGKKYHLNTTGNPVLATAGSGDVLAGLIAGFMAQGMGAFDAAVLAAHLHGLAADLWVAEYGASGLIARDLPAWIPQAMKQYRQSSGHV